MDLSWMAWTTPTAIFFIAIALTLVFMIIWAIKKPQAPRRGILGIETTPGDRLFIGLLGSAFISLAWLGLLGTPIWGALVICGIYVISVFKWV
jgi:predicted small integral membrane protein